MPGVEFYTAAVETSDWIAAGAYIVGALVIAEIVDRALSRRGRKLSQAVMSFVKDESGPTAVEYAVMLALIVVVCITAITTLGTNANNTFSYVGTKIAGS